MEKPNGLQPIFDHASFPSLQYPLHIIIHTSYMNSVVPERFYIFKQEFLDLKWKYLYANCDVSHCEIIQIVSNSHM